MYNQFLVLSLKAELIELDLYLQKAESTRTSVTFVFTAFLLSFRTLRGYSFRQG